MELVDLYDEDRVPLGRTAERYGKKGLGEYRAVVHVCLFNQAGQMLIQQRTACKHIWPGRWDVTVGGGVDAGETPRQGAQREVREELGLDLDLSGVRPSMTVNFDGGFDDFFLVEREVDLTALRLQEDEVAQVRWADWPEVERMLDNGEFIVYPKSFLRFLFDMRGTFGFPTK